MADKVILNKSKLTAIGDAIRSKTGKTASLTLDAMANEISNISTGSSGSGGVIEVSNLPETGEEGSVYLQNKIVDMVFVHEGSEPIFIGAAQGLTISGEIVNELPTENIIPSTESSPYIYVYNNSIWVYMNNNWMDFCSMNQVNYNGLINSTNDAINAGMYVLCSKTYYIYENNIFNQLNGSGNLSLFQDNEIINQPIDITKYANVIIKTAYYCDDISINTTKNIKVYGRDPALTIGDRVCAFKEWTGSSGGIDISDTIIILTNGETINVSGTNIRILDTYSSEIIVIEILGDNCIIEITD